MSRPGASPSPGFLARLRAKYDTLRTDLRHGGLTGGLKPSRFHDLGAIQTVSTDYALLPALLGPVLKPGDVFVDVGCGKGRVLNWVLDDGRAQTLFGIELDKDVAAAVARRFSDNLAVTIVAGDALTSLPDSANVFYLWHPFEAPIMRRFRDTLVAKYRRLGTLAQVRLVYHNSMYEDVWREQAGCRVEPIALPPITHQTAVLITFPDG
jgi:SAM-dependent methyltransferase